MPRKKTLKKYENELYLVRVVGDVDPEILGPYPHDDARDLDAGRLRSESDEDGVFWLDTHLCGIDPRPRIGAYRAGYMETLIDRHRQKVTSHD